VNDGPLVPLPDRGRRYTSSREVRLGDADGRGRLRLDALARYLQDVANDDGREALGEDASSWVVRRSVVDVTRWPRLGEVVTLATFLGGVGGRWAERRTSVRVVDRACVECASLWVHLDLRTGRPVPLPERFLPIYGEVYGDRKVSGRLSLPPPPPGAARSPWMTRAADFDVLGHVNNAAYWEAVEEAFAGDAIARRDLRFELEYRAAIEPGDEVVGGAVGDGGGGRVSLGAADVRAAARMSALPAA
jgi:acyl-ACP thioesterase